MRVVCIGDSVTYGQFVDRGLCWTSLLAAGLGPGVEVVNRGVCADTTRLGLERFPRDLQWFEPAVVMVQFGFNDANRWQTDRGLPRVSETAYAENLCEMADRAFTFGALYVVFLTSYATQGSEAYNADLRRYNARMLQAAQRSRAILVDIASWQLDPECFLPDGLHLSAAGHAEYARLVQPTIEGLLRAAQYVEAA